MRARADAKKAEAKTAIIRAWNMAALTGAAFAGKLEPVEHYLNSAGNNAARDNAALLGTLFAMRRRGIFMTVERVERLH